MGVIAEGIPRGCQGLFTPVSLGYPLSVFNKNLLSRDTSTVVTSCPIGMSLPADSSCEGRVSLHFTQSGLSMPAAAGVVDEKGSEYILTHTGPRELDGHPLGGVWVGVWFSSQLCYPFGKGPGQHIIRCLKNTKCENEQTTMAPTDDCHDHLPKFRRDARARSPLFS